MEEVFINKVANSSLVTINLESYLAKEEIVGFDITAHLYMELLLKEKDFRASMLTIEWAKYQNKHLAIYCSTDAIIPVWAYMLIVAYATPFATSVHLATIAETEKIILLNNINSIDPIIFKGQRLVIKGCGETPIPNDAYVAITHKLQPVAKSIMYGEPCSTVPIYKNKNLM